MLISLIRTVILYLVIIFAMRLMGKRQINELQPSEFVATLMISNLAAIPMQNIGIPILSGLIPILVLIISEIFISVFMLKSCRFREIVCGRPVVIVSEGAIDQKSMHALRISSEDLMEQLRQLDIFNLDDVAFAIMETNGKVSVIKKPDKQDLNTGMMGIDLPDPQLDVVVVSDGEMAKSSLKFCGLSEEWVNKTLSKKKLDISEVFMMTANKNKEFSLVKKDKEKV